MIWKTSQKPSARKCPHDVLCTVANLFATALKQDKHGKGRFQMLCARIDNLHYENHLQSNLVPVKIRAIQRHSAQALQKAGGCLPMQLKCIVRPMSQPRAKSRLRICAMSEVPKVAYHRTMRSHWKGIAKYGLLPGGGDTVNSVRAHVYLADKRYGEDGYRSGLRGKCPVEVKVALAQAVEASIIFSTSSMDGIMTAERIPSQFIISIMEGGKMIWNRAESNLEPSSWTKQPGSSSPRDDVRLVARHDRDLGDEPMPDAGTGRHDAPQTTSAPTADDQGAVNSPATREGAPCVSCSKECRTIYRRVPSLYGRICQRPAHMHNLWIRTSSH